MKLQQFFKKIYNNSGRGTERILTGIKKTGRKVNIKKLVIFTGIFIGVIFLGMVSFIALVNYGAFGKLPPESDLQKIQHPQSSEVYSADSVLMGRFYVQNRLDLREGELIPEIRYSLLYTEDARFYEHGGIDFRSLLRVLIKTILLDDESSGGGSTISQQLAKNLYPRKDYGIISLPVNKVREMLIARKLEDIYTKDEILEIYLNTVPFGEDTYGIRTAAKLYFDKNPRELNLEEAALLVGMLKATSYYNPRRHPQRAITRRNVVLKQLNRYEQISDQTYDSLRALPLKLNYSAIPYYAGIAPYFREHLRQELSTRVSEWEKDNGEKYNLYTDGLQIYTTIHSTMQQYAEEAVKEHMEYLQQEFEKGWIGGDMWKYLKQGENKYILEQASDNQMNDSATKIMKVFSYEGEKERVMTPIDSVRYFMKFLQSGYVAMDVNSRQVLAWVGGIDFKYFKYDHVLSKRQAGSVFKPLVYLAALQNGVEPCDWYPNDSIVYEEYDSWSPRNADRKYGGEYSVKGALTNSINTVSAALMIETGPGKVVDLAHDMGVESELPEVPSLALGTANVSLFEMVNAYGTLASGGIKKEPVYLLSVTDRQGKVLYEAENDRGRRVVPEDEAKTITAILENVVNAGTGGAIRYKYQLYNDIAGKTGTSQNYSDGWFIGYTPEIVAGAWVGGEIPAIRFRSSRYGQGAASALPIFATFLKKIYDDPEFADMQKSSFQIDQEIMDKLDCDDFREEPPLPPAIKNLWDRFKKFRIFRKRNRE